MQTLDVSGTKVTDAALKDLTELKSLQTLDLANTKVTNAGLKELAGMKNLKTLTLSRPLVTDAGVRELQKALPTCAIDLYGNTTQTAQPQVTTTTGPVRQCVGRLFRRIW